MPAISINTASTQAKTHSGESTRADGDWLQWDRLWKQTDRYEKQLFCTGDPQTLRQLLHRTYFEDLRQLLSRERVPRSVELGAGRGTMSMYLSQHGCDVTLVDLSPAGLSTALANFSEERLPPPTVIEGDVRGTGLPAESFGCVCSTGLLEHFSDPRPVLAESLRLLRPGGVLFHIIVPEVDQRRWLPLLGLFNPIGAALREAKRIARRLSKPPRRLPSEALRTVFPRSQWVQWMHELGQPHVACLPYNPLHHLYRSPLLDQRVSFPLWRAHIARRRRLHRYPLLATSDSLAQCQLLVCRKHP